MRNFKHLSNVGLSAQLQLREIRLRGLSEEAKKLQEEIRRISQEIQHRYETGKTRNEENSNADTIL
jgi:predicted ATP-grasp superfamily ATP-dependent carboligase